jgi:hypothetical protein
MIDETLVAFFTSTSYAAKNIAARIGKRAHKGMIPRNQANLFPRIFFERTNREFDIGLDGLDKGSLVEDTYDLEVISNKSSDLLVIDLVGDSLINKLSAKTNDITDKYQISSNQNIEMYGESVSGQLIGLEIFAKGIGTIDVSVSSEAVQTIAVNSPNRYSSYKVGLSEQMNMLDYTIEISNGVKIMQRILGKVILMEKFNG